MTVSGTISHRQSHRRADIMPVMFQLFLVLVLTAAASACTPEPAPAPQAAVTLVSDRACRAIDGDTIDCGAVRVRLVNVDTPELQGQCAAEIAQAERARDFTAARLAAGPVTIKPDNKRPRDRYGRALAWVLVEGRDIGEDLIAAGLARRWDGRRRPWCDK